MTAETRLNRQNDPNLYSSPASSVAIPPTRATFLGTTVRDPGSAISMLDSGTSAAPEGPAAWITPSSGRAVDRKKLPGFEGEWSRPLEARRNLAPGRPKNHRNPSIIQWFSVIFKWFWWKKKSIFFDFQWVCWKKQQDWNFGKKRGNRYTKKITRKMRAAYPSSLLYIKKAPHIGTFQMPKKALLLYKKLEKNGHWPPVSAFCHNNRSYQIARTAFLMIRLFGNWIWRFCVSF
jgi:hypothetical protein